MEYGKNQNQQELRILEVIPNNTKITRFDSIPARSKIERKNRKSFKKMFGDDQNGCAVYESHTKIKDGWRFLISEERGL